MISTYNWLILSIFSISCGTLFWIKEKVEKIADQYSKKMENDLLKIHQEHPTDYVIV